VTGLLALFALAIAIVLLAYLWLLARHLRHPPRRTAGWALARKRPSDPGELEVHGGPKIAWSADAVRGVPFWSIARDETTLANAATPTVILLHGWGHSRIDGLSRLEPWLSRGFRIVLPDLRGHGDAEGASTLGDGDALDVLAIVDTLPASPLVLAGHSMGGVVAIRVGAMLSERGSQDGASRGVRRVSLDAEDQSPLGGRDTTDSTSPVMARPDSAASPDRALLGVIAISAYERLRVPAIADLTSRGYTVGPLIHPLLAILRLLGIREHSTRAAAERLAAPLLVVHGERDASCPLEDAKAYAAAAREHRLEVIADAGHNDLWREHGELLEHALERWLDATMPTLPPRPHTNAVPR
jgi:pimeloyl-ACP methyl ester carboxylesterase